MTKGASLWWVFSYSPWNKWNDLFQQDAGQDVLHSGQQVSNMELLQLKRLPLTDSAVQMGLNIAMVGEKAVSKEPVELFWTVLSSGQKTLTSSLSTG